MGRNLDKVACTTCRAGKRKCEGKTPCKRCKRLGIADTCEPGPTQKRGRPFKEPPVPGEKKERSAPPSDEMIQSEILPPSPLAVPVLAVSPRQALLSALLSHGEAVIANRPREVAVCFDIDLGDNFVVTQMPPMEQSFAALLAPYQPLLKRQCMAVIGPVFAAARVVAGEMHSVPLNVVGKTLGEIVVGDPLDYEDDSVQEQALLDFIYAEPGMCCINRRVFPAQEIEEGALEAGSSDRLSFATRAALLFDEHGMARYMFSAIVDPAAETGDDPFGMEDMWEGSPDDDSFAGMSTF